jgi:membrane protein involved in colicin uptake
VTAEAQAGEKPADEQTGNEPEQGEQKGEDTTALKRALEAERKARGQAEKRAKQFEDAQKSEAEKVAERAATAEKAATASEQKYLRLKIGTSKGLPADLAERLRGESEDEMTADADQLIAGLKASQESEKASDSPDFSAGARGGGGQRGSVDDLIRDAKRR